MSTPPIQYTHRDLSNQDHAHRASSQIASASRWDMTSIVPKRRWYLPLKWVFEYLLAVVLFIVSIPMLVIAAGLIKLSSKGPVFYLQTRVGKNGKLFRVIKLRTMVNDAEAKTGPVWSTQNDPRITRLGKFLRDTHIDEFPQLINVLFGHMALVGPRPERPEIAEQLEWKIPNYSERTNVRPGITGLSQMLLPPDSDLESVRRKQIVDLYYVTEVSAWLDLRIFASTAWLLVKSSSQGVLQAIALPSSSKLLSDAESFLGADSELLIGHQSVLQK